MKIQALHMIRYVIQNTGFMKDATYLFKVWNWLMHEMNEQHNDV